MKSLFGLIAAALVLATATVSFAGCPDHDSSPRGPVLNPPSVTATATTTTHTVRAVR